jgi:hypothetical protein
MLGVPATAGDKRRGDSGFFVARSVLFEIRLIDTDEENEQLLPMCITLLA